VDPLLHRLEPRRRRRVHVLRAVGGEALRRLLGAVAQRRERGALILVAADALRDGVERPVVELGPLLAAAADELLDHGGERPAAGAAQRGIAAFGLAAARPILALARPPPIIALAGAAPILIAGAALVACPPPVVIARAPAIVGRARAVLATILILRAVFAARLPRILCAVLRWILVASLLRILSAILLRILFAALLWILCAISLRILGRAGAPPVVEARWCALAVAAVIAVMAAAGRGARGHAHP